MCCPAVGLLGGSGSLSITLGVETGSLGQKETGSLGMFAVCPLGGPTATLLNLRPAPCTSTLKGNVARQGFQDVDPLSLLKAAMVSKASLVCTTLTQISPSRTCKSNPPQGLHCRVDV